MRIGIDIDNTITHTRELIYDYGVQFNQENHIQANCSSDGYKIEDIFHWDDKLAASFMDKYLISIYENVQPKIGALDVLSYLQRNHEIFLVTARNKYHPYIEQTTLNWLEKYKIQYDELLMNTTNNMHHCSKLDTCMEKKLDLMVEDHHDISLEISQQLPVIMFDYPYNAHVKDPNIFRVKNWLEVKTIIDKLAKIRSA